MKEQLIEFETAILAKEKGFDIYYNGYNFYNSETGNIQKGTTFSIDCRVLAPTQSLLQKWLREEKRTIVEAPVFDDWEGWNYRILQEDIMSPFFIAKEIDEEFNSYEKALEKGLQEALKLI